jgi:protein phosphatase
VHTVANLRLGRLQASGSTNRGRVRPINEDCLGIDPDHQLFIVADGMGGHNAGEVAARLAVDAILDFVVNRAASTTWPFGYDDGASPAANLLRTAVEVANGRVFDAAGSSPQCAGMGTTIVTALVRDDVLTIAHVGDSRAYLIAERQLRQLTVDDSWAEAILGRDRSVDLEALKDHPMRHALTSVVGTRARVDVHVTERALACGDVLLLTTDGVHGVLEPRELVRACELAYDVQALAEGLVQAAIASGSRDNCTAIAARLESAVR